MSTITEIYRFAAKDWLVFGYRWLFDVSVLVSLAPLFFSIYQNRLIANAVGKGKAHETALTAVKGAQPIVSISLHVSSFITAFIIFTVQNAPLLMSILINHARVKNFNSQTVFYTISAATIMAAAAVVVIRGCSVTPSHINKYIHKGESSFPPAVPLTYIRFMFALAVFALNPFFQYVDGTIAFN